MDSSGHESSLPALKRVKVSTACDTCRTKKIKCDGVQPECGPCRSKLRKAVRCSWNTRSSRCGSPNPREQILRLQQRIRELEQSAYSEKEAIGDQELYHSVGANVESDRNDVHPRGTNVGAGPNQNPSPETRLQAQHQSGLETSQNETLKDIQDDPERRSPASAMVGSVEANHGPQGFFGGSSVGNFVTQIRRAAAQQMGTYSKTPPSIHSQGSQAGKAPGSSAQRRILSLDECALPPKGFADSLMAIYWDAVHPLYPFIDRVEMTGQYESLFSAQAPTDIDASLLCALNLIFALCCQLNTTKSAEWSQVSAQVFFRRAQNLLDLWKIEGSLESVQVLLLLGQYLQSTDEPLQCWIFVGSAIRMAQSLGLHLIEVTEGAASLRLREIMRRVWHACILMDRVLAMTYGRPTMISRAVASTTPPPLAIDEDAFSYNPAFRPQVDANPSRLDFFISSLKLYDILEELLESSYSNPARRAVSEKDTHNFNMRADYGISFLDLDEKLMAWEMNLPQHLKSFTGPQTSSQAMVFVRQAVVLRQRFLHLRLLTLRPILSALITSDSTNSDNVTFGTNLSNRIAHQCSMVCVKVAQEAIDLVYTHSGLDWATTGLLAAWWYNVLFVYSAAAVLVATKLPPLAEMELPRESILASWQRAVQILKTYQAYSKSIPKLLVTLELLMEEVPERYSQFWQHHSTSSRHDAHEVATHAPANRQRDKTSHTDMARSEENSFSTMTPATNIPEVTSSMPAGEDFFEPGLDGVAGDLYFSFHPADLSWLNSVPIEL